MDAFDDEIHRRHAFGGMAHEMRKVLRLAHADALLSRHGRA